MHKTIVWGVTIPQLKFRINIWKGCGHSYGCGRMTGNKPMTTLRRWTKGYHNYQETNYDETEASSHLGCVQQFKNILELLNPEDEGTMILQHGSNYE